jgi:hypothetical protein
MLLFSRINRIFNQQIHGLAAAHKVAFSGVEHFNDISTYTTFIYLKSFGHFLFPPFKKIGHRFSQTRLPCEVQAGR